MLRVEIHIGGCRRWSATQNRMQETSSSALEGLKFLHKNGTIHREIKQPNILLKTKSYPTETVLNNLVVPKFGFVTYASNYNITAGLVLLGSSDNLWHSAGMPLRQRKKRSTTEEQHPDQDTESEDSKDSSDEYLNLHVMEEIAKERAKEELRKEKSFFASRKFLFPLGIFLGILVGAAILAPPTTTLEMPAQLGVILSQSQSDLSAFLSDIMTSLDIDWGRFETEWEAFKARLPEPWKLNNDGREFQVGERMRDRGLRAEYPVVLVPGVVSTSLESWSTSDEFRGWFREKVWGGMHMIAQVTLNREKWMKAVMLDPITGLDPPGVKVRAAQGIDAASSFVQGYWIWSKIVENLAVVGYDPNNLLLAAYDWRLSYWNLEERDGYFSRLKTSIEEYRRRHDKKIVLVAHSMGSSIVLYFFKWVESPRFGGGGPTWVEDHIESFISVGGTHLGVPKAMTAFLSGEMKDTVELNPIGSYVLERFFSRKERARLFRSWAGSASMWIKGGDAIWGNHTHAPDDPGLPNCTASHGQFLSFRPAELLAAGGKGANLNESSVVTGLGIGKHSGGDGDETDSSNGNGDVLPQLAPDTANMTAEEAGTWILERAPASFQKMMEANYSCGIERDEEQLKKNDDDPRKWSNPLESRLPNAPSMKIYCIYGHGKETERSYWYARGEYEYDEDQSASVADAADAQCVDPEDVNCTNPRAPLDLPLSRKNWIDYEVTDEAGYPKTKNGVRLGEGDGTVSLMSLGAMCVEGWKRKRWNPSGIQVITTELPHLPTPSIPRGGANTSDHVDILGSTGLNELIVKVATGAGDEIGDTFVSRIREYARRVQWD